VVGSPCLHSDDNTLLADRFFIPGLRENRSANAPQRLDMEEMKQPLHRDIPLQF
jgi:hypothetical protein